MAETREQFETRVERVTGVPFGEIPVGEDGDLLGGQIWARRGDEYIVTHGYPDSSYTHPKDGLVEEWNPQPENFRRVKVA